MCTVNEPLVVYAGDTHNTWRGHKKTTHIHKKNARQHRHNKHTNAHQDLGAMHREDDAPEGQSSHKYLRSARVSMCENLWLARNRLVGNVLHALTRENARWANQAPVHIGVWW
jgi:hypothetical protein